MELGRGEKNIHVTRKMITHSAKRSGLHKCIYTQTHKHFYTSKNLATTAYGHPSFRWSAVSKPLFCFSWCLPSLTQRWNHTINRGQSPPSSITRWSLLFDMTIKSGAIGGFGSLKLFCSKLCSLVMGDTDWISRHTVINSTKEKHWKSHDLTKPFGQEVSGASVGASPFNPSVTLHWL